MDNWMEVISDEAVIMNVPFLGTVSRLRRISIDALNPLKSSMVSIDG